MISYLTLHFRLSPLKTGTMLGFFSIMVLALITAPKLMGTWRPTDPSISYFGNYRDGTWISWAW